MSYARYVDESGPTGRTGASAAAHTALSSVPLEDEREILTKGAESMGSQVAKRPLLGSYLPVDPVHR